MSAPPIIPTPTDLIPTHLTALVKKQHTFKKDVKLKQTVDFIVADVSQNPKRSKNDVGCIARVCTLIENIIKKKDNIDKFEVVKQVFNILFGNLTQPEIDQLKNIVQFLLDSDMISKLPYSTLITSYLKKVISNNFLFRDPSSTA